QHLSCLLPQLCFELCSSKDILHPYIHIYRIHWGLECYLDLGVGGIHTHVGGWHTTPMWIHIRCSFFLNFYYSGVDPLPRERGATLLYFGECIMVVGVIHTHVGGSHRSHMWINIGYSFFLIFYYSGFVLRFMES